MAAEENRLIDEFNVELMAPECTPGAEWWAAKVSFAVDISEVLPYLNAKISPTDYHHDARILIWDNDGVRYAFRSKEIAIAPIKDNVIARKLSDEVVSLVCDVWDRRAEIEPDISGKTRPPSMLQILKVLPGTNCRECDYATCMAFAAALMQHQTELEKCPCLSQNVIDELVVILNPG